jgi:hypothetical protein
VYASEKSHDAIVPMKLPHNEARVSAEVVEGRASVKENIRRLHTCPTPCGITRVPGASGYAENGFPLAAIIQDKNRMR